MKKQTLGLCLVIIGTVLSIFAALSVRGVYIPAEAKFGLADYMPPSFWVGFITLMCGAYLVSFAEKRLYQLLAIFCVTIIMWFTPSFVEMLPRRHDVYWHWSTASWISETGHLSFTDPTVSYLQYPGIFLIANTLITITSLDKMVFLRFFPILASCLWMLTFYIVAMTLFESRRKVYFATIVPMVANVFMFQNHFSPSATAAAIFPLLLFLMVKSTKYAEKKWSFLYISIFLFSVILHPIFPLLFIAFLLVIFFYKKMSREKDRSGFYIPLFGVIYFSWNVFVAKPATDGLAEFFKSLVYNISSFTFGQRMSETYGTSFEFVPFEVSLIRRAIIFSFVLLASYYILKNDIVTNRLRKITWPTLIFSCTVFFAFIIGLTSFGFELSYRFLCLIIPLATLIILTSKAKTLLTVFFMISLLVFPLLTFSVYYHDEAEYAMYQAKYEGLTFLAKSMKDGDTLFTDFGGIINFFTHFTKDVKIISHMYELYDHQEIWSSDIICYTISSFARYFYFEGTTENSFVRSRHLSENNPNFNKIYDNWALQIFKRTSYGQ
ncbi:MAG: hypothetical protein ACTSV7_11535 [Candidatus Baldrarchaeia archaeon]